MDFLGVCWALLVALLLSIFFCNKVWQKVIPSTKMIGMLASTITTTTETTTTTTTSAPTSTTTSIHRPVSNDSKFRTLPIFGNLFDLGSHPHRTLSHLSATHGSVMDLRLGTWKAVVLNDSESCREALVHNGRHTASRPNFESYLHYSHGKSLSFQPFNAVWQVQRKAASRTVAKLINSGVVARLSRRQAEKLIDSWSTRAVGGQAFDPTEDVARMVGQFVYSFCYGEEERLEENREFSDILLRPNPGTDMLAAGNNIDLLPWFLRFVSSGKQRKHVHRMNEFVRLNDLMRVKVLENVRKETAAHNHTNDDDDDDDNDDNKNDYDDNNNSNKNNFGDGGKEFRSVMHAMILEVERLFKEDEEEIYVEASNCFKGTTLHRDCLLNLPSEFLSAGSETSTAVLLWLIRFVADRADVQTRIHAELDEHVGLAKEEGSSKVFIEHQDRIHLPYTEACFQESLRLMAVVPFALPHSTTSDLVLGGRGVPTDTLLLPNLWAAGRDPKIWDSPDIFRPERHLDRCPFGTGGGPRQESFFPFGLGKRRCVGEPVGRMVNFVTFANLMLRFEFRLVEQATAEIEPGNFFQRLLRGSRGQNFSADGPNDVMESFGDVMKPRSYKIVLSVR